MVRKVKRKLEGKGLYTKVRLKYLSLQSELNSGLIPYLNPKEIANESGYDVILVDGKLRGKQL